MKAVILALSTVLACACSPAWAQTEIAKPVEPCSTNEPKPHYDFDDAAVTAHRLFELPIVTYPFNSKHVREPNMAGGLRIGVLIDETGHVSCYVLDKDAPPLTQYEKPVINGLAGWHYEPFVIDGKPSTAYIQEIVYEEEGYEKIVPMPDGAASSVTVSLNRTGCFGRCPAYAVSLKADGSVVFVGGAYTDVTGRHEYQVNAEAVSALVKQARELNIWSARKSYNSRVTDLPSYQLTLSIGGKTKVIRDYGGSMIGMPHAVSDFMDAVDAVSGSQDLINLSVAGVARLKAEGYDFTSEAAADLLANANANPRNENDDAIIALIEAGAPLHGGHQSFGYGAKNPDEADLLADAVKRNRSVVIDALISKGMLYRDGSPDQHAIDTAFDAAIAVGHISDVQNFWTYHPSLTFEEDISPAPDTGPRTRQTPVTLLLSAPYTGPDEWDGRQIAEFLLNQGCDINASDAHGKTLLHIAAKSGDAAFVRYLLERGANVNAIDDMGDAPLNESFDDETSILLLEAGADPTRKTNYGYSFAEDARLYDDKTILEWLLAHGIMAPMQNPGGGF